MQKLVLRSLSSLQMQLRISGFHCKNLLVKNRHAFYFSTTQLQPDDVAAEKERQQDILYIDSEKKIKAILSNCKMRTSQLLVERDRNYSSEGEVISLPYNRMIVIGDYRGVDANYFRVLSANIMCSEVKHIFSSSGERKISVDVEGSKMNELEELFGEAAVRSLIRLKGECLRICREHFEDDVQGVGEKKSVVLTEAGSILSWLSPQLKTDAISLINGQPYSYTDPHCDKANNFEYDVGFLLYLNSEFEGGDFCFMDMNVDRFVQPKAGRFLSFTSSIENIHRVTPVIKGNRLLLSVWYKMN